MATEYTHTQVKSGFQIHRNTEHVATYNPKTDSTSFTEGNDKYAGPVGREVVKLKMAPIKGEQPTAADTPMPATVKEVAGETEESFKLAGVMYNNYCVAVGGEAFNGDPLPVWIEFSTDATKAKQVDAWRTVGVIALFAPSPRQRQHITSLEREVVELKNHASGEPTVRITDRYQGIDTNPTGAPAQDPMLGDLTPTYIEWARIGGMSKADFVQVYTGRIPDLTYNPAPVGALPNVGSPIDS